MQLRRFLICFLLVWSYFSHAQLVTNNSRSVNDLVRNVLTGDGVEISNVTYSGLASQVGEFFGSSSNIGLSHGIILSTGVVLDGVDNGGRKTGPVGPNNNGGASTIHNRPGDPDVLALTSSTEAKDAAIIEFDFVPQGDTVRFRYVFASEEYPQYVGSSKNDAFGFFISGPGIAGMKNIALLPDNVTPVSINNVNGGQYNIPPGTNAQYYINNGNGASGPSYTNPQAVNFNGFTVVLTAVAKVTPCQTYHLKIAISDIGDGAIDSGVFLEASSLYSVPTFELEQGVDYAPTSSNTILFEGCSNGELTVKRSEKLSSPLIIPFRVLGTASNGVDYNMSPSNSISFAPGETSKKITITSIRDAVAEGDESIILRFRNPSVCKTDSVDMTYLIRDLPPMNTASGVASPTCPGDQISLAAQGSGGVPAITYQWSTGEVGAVKNITANADQVHYYVATDACGQTRQDSVEVTLPVYPPLVVQALRDTTVVCRGTTVRFNPSVSGGAGNYQYSWNTGQTSSSISPQILSSGSFSVDVVDQCGETGATSSNVTLNYPAFTATSSPDINICYGESTNLVGGATGGRPPYSFFWEGIGGSNYNALGVESKSYLFQAYDSCGIIPAESTTRVTVQKPTAAFEINAPIPEPNEKISFLNGSQGAVSYRWTFGNGTTSTEKQPFTKYDDATEYEITLVAFDDLGCRDTSVQTIALVPPLYYYLPNAFSPNGDDINDLFVGKGVGVTDFQLYIYNRWGNLVFSTTSINDPWDGTLPSGKQAPVDVYVVKATAKSAFRDDKEYKIVKTVTLVR